MKERFARMGSEEGWRLRWWGVPCDLRRGCRRSGGVRPARSCDESGRQLERGTGGCCFLWTEKILRMGNLKKLDYWSEPSSRSSVSKFKEKKRRGGGGGRVVRALPALRCGHFKRRRRATRLHAASDILLMLFRVLPLVLCALLLACSPSKAQHAEDTFDQ